MARCVLGDRQAQLEELRARERWRAPRASLTASRRQARPAQDGAPSSAHPLGRRPLRREPPVQPRWAWPPSSRASRWSCRRLASTPLELVEERRAGRGDGLRRHREHVRRSVAAPGDQGARGRRYAPLLLAECVGRHGPRKAGNEARRNELEAARELLRQGVIARGRADRRRLGLRCAVLLAEPAGVLHGCSELPLQLGDAGARGGEPPFQRIPRRGLPGPAHHMGGWRLRRNESGLVAPRNHRPKTTKAKPRAPDTRAGMA